ncbi:MAG: RDD family protein [Caldilineales bacterium]
MKSCAVLARQWFLPTLFERRMRTPMVGKGLLGQYAGFVSRAVGFVLDILIVIGLIWIVNFSITLPLQLLLGFRCQGMHAAESSQCSRSGGSEDGVLFCGYLDPNFAFTILAGPAYFILFWAMGGQTIGQYVGGVRVVRLDGRKMNFKYSLVRYLGYFVSFAALGLGYFWVLWDDRRQGFRTSWRKRWLSTPGKRARTSCCWTAFAPGCE